MRNLTPNETALAERGCDEVPPTRLVQRRDMPGNKADGAKMARSCEGLVPEGNLMIVERHEDKTDAQQATRLKAARHFLQIRKHTERHTAQRCRVAAHTQQHTTKKGNDMKLEIDWLEMAKAVVKAIWPFIAGAFGGLFSGCTFGGIGPIFA